MWIHLAVVVAFAQSPAELPSVDELAALPDAAARLARLTTVAGDYDANVRAQAAIAVVRELDEAGRTDPAVIRGFLEDALSGDGSLRDQAVIAARQGELPPASSATPTATATATAPPPPAPHASLEAVQAYRDRRLYTGNRQVVMSSLTVSPYGTAATTSSHDGWTVYQGPRALAPREFATLVADKRGLDRLTQQNQNVASGSAIAAVLGALAIGGGIALVSDQDEANDGPGALLASVGGGVGFGIALGLPLRHSILQNWVASVYSQDEANELVHHYNEQLRTELDLTDDDVREIETLGP